MAIDWRNEPVIDSVQLPGGETKYWVQDTEAREKIETLANATHFIGVSTTEITDGGTEKPTINGEEVNPVAGDIVIWKPLTGAPLEFIWDGSKWNLLGGQALEGLGDLAFKDSAEGSYIPEGSIELSSSFTNVITDVDHDFDITLTMSGTEPESYTGKVEIGIDVERSSISYFGSSQALSYINLASIDDRGRSYSSVVTYIDFESVGAVTNFTSGELPTISNQNTVTVTMGTGSSSTTLIFNLSDIGFNPGTQPSVSYYNVACAANDGTIKYAGVSFLTLNPSTVDRITDIDELSELYYSIALNGSISTNSETALTDITATFSGTSSTITVS